MAMKPLVYIPDGNSLDYLETTSNYVNSVTLAANVAQSFTKPTGITKLLFSTNFVVGDSISFGSVFGTVKLTAVAANPTSAQFVPLSTLALTLAALIIQLQALTLPVVGTFSVTDTNTSITFTNTLSAVAPLMAAVKATGSNVLTQTAGARFCRLSAGALFYYSAATVATIAAGAVVNGGGSISVPATVQPMFNIDDITSISVIAPAGIVVSAEFWG